MGVCVCVKTSEKSSFCNSGITRPIKLEFGVNLKISFSLKFIYGLGFYDVLNFRKNVCNRSSCYKFWAIELYNSL